MNKRQKLKAKKKQNMARMTSILSAISDCFSPHSLRHGDGYALFTFGPHSVCHFSLRETPDWRYAVWLLDEGYYVFGDHRSLVDKFKPSRTHVSERDVDNFCSHVRRIIEDPRREFVLSLRFGEEPEGETEADKLAYVESRFYDFFEREALTERLHQELLPRMLHFLQEKANEIPDVHGFLVRDMSSPDYHSYPRYHVDVVLPDSWSDEQDQVEPFYQSIDTMFWDEGDAIRTHLDEQDVSTLNPHAFELYGAYYGMPESSSSKHPFHYIITPD